MGTGHLDRARTGMSSRAVGGVDKRQLETEMNGTLGDLPELSTISTTERISMTSIQEDAAEFIKQHQCIPALVLNLLILIGLVVGGCVAYTVGFVHGTALTPSLLHQREGKGEGGSGGDTSVSSLVSPRCTRELAKFEWREGHLCHRSLKTVMQNPQGGLSLVFAPALNSCFCKCPFLFTHGNSTLVIASPPKVGTNSLRSIRSSSLVEKTHSPQNQCHDGCDIVTVNANFISALLVREPLSRLASGIIEMLSHHCFSWMEWRSQHNRTNPFETNRIGGCKMAEDSSKWFKDPQRIPWVVREYVRDMQLAYELGKGPTLIQGGGGNGPSQGWTRQSWKFSEHTDPQIKYFTGWSAPRLDALIHIEELADRWPRFQEQAGLPTDFIIPHGHHRKKAVDLSPSAIFALLGTEEWAFVCMVFMVDYVCLGYPLPPQCPNRDQVA